MHHAATLGWWERVWPLLATAGLSLLVLFLIQVYIAERVEPRKRREDRWEEDVRRLGEYLTFDFTDATDSLLQSRWWMAYLREAESETIGAPLAPETHQAAEAEFRAAQDQYRAVRSRLRWLVERVTALDFERSDLNRVWRGSAILWLSLESGAFLDPSEVVRPAELESLQKEFQESRRQLTKDVESLIVAHPPRRPSRAKTVARGLRRRVRKQRQKPSSEG